MKIAIILCCFNRKEMTKRCLEQMHLQIQKSREHKYNIFVCDDASTDGTPQMIKNDFPEVRLIESKGNLYWCKSMYLGMRTAQKEAPDIYLMINDDVDFYDNMLDMMINAYKEKGPLCGIVGSTRHRVSKVPSYGGRTDDGKIIVPNGTLQECVLTNWNCFMIDKETVNKIGIIDGKYQHSWGDFDYAWRMKKQNVPIYVASDYIGICETNDIKGTFRDKNVKRSVRLRKLLSPKGMPFYSYIRYHIVAYGKRRILTYVYGYISLIFYIMLKRDIR